MPTIAATKDAVPDEVAQSATTTNSGSEANPTSNNGNDMTSNTNINTSGNGTYANEEDDPEFPLRQKSFKLLHEAGDCLKHCHIVLQRLLEYAPPLAIPEISPTVSIALTIDIRHIAIMTVKLISKPYLNGSGNANHAALLPPEKFTSPMKIAIIYAVIIPKSTDELEIIPFVVP